MTDPFGHPKYVALRNDSGVCEHGSQARKCANCEVNVLDIIVQEQADEIARLKAKLGLR